jgi:hypothetical protein
MESLSADDLFSLLKINDPTEYEKCLMLARLLKEKGDIYSSMNNETESYNYYLKSLKILIKIGYAEIKNEIEHEFLTIEEVSDKLDNYELPPEVNKYLHDYYLSTGEFLKAEDFTEID